MGRTDLGDVKKQEKGGDSGVEAKQLTVFKVVVMDGYMTLSNFINKFRVELFERVHV